jgi:hypothetical protein
VEYGGDLAVYLPGVAAGGCGVAREDEDQHLPFPDGLALEELGDTLAGDELGLGTVGLVDGLVEEY